MGSATQRQCRFFCGALRLWGRRNDAEHYQPAPPWGGGVSRWRKLFPISVGIARVRPYLAIRLSAPHFAVGCPPIRGRIVRSGGDFPPTVTQAPPNEISNFRSCLRKFIKLFQLLSSGWKITQVASFGENWPRRVHFRPIFRHRTSHAILRTLAITREFPSPSRAESMFGEREVA